MMAFNDGKKDFEASAWMEGIKKTFPENRDHFNPPHESSLQNNEHLLYTQKKQIKEISISWNNLTFAGEKSHLISSSQPNQKNVQE